MKGGVGRLGWCEPAFFFFSFWLAGIGDPRPSVGGVCFEGGEREERGKREGESPSHLTLPRARSMRTGQKQTPNPQTKKNQAPPNRKISATLRFPKKWLFFDRFGHRFGQNFLGFSREIKIASFLCDRPNMARTKRTIVVCIALRIALMPCACGANFRKYKFEKRNMTVS